MAPAGSIRDNQNTVFLQRRISVSSPSPFQPSLTGRMPMRPWPIPNWKASLLPKSWMRPTHSRLQTYIAC